MRDRKSTGMLYGHSPGHSMLCHPTCSQLMKLQPTRPSSIVVRLSSLILCLCLVFSIPSFVFSIPKLYIVLRGLPLVGLHASSDSMLALGLTALYGYIVFWCATIGAQHFSFCPASPITEPNLSAAALARSDLLPVTQIIQGLLTRPRYHRHHFSHIRLDRARRLTRENSPRLYTIFVEALSGPTIPLG